MKGNLDTYICDFYHPQRNLNTKHGPHNGPEDEFAVHFTRAYKENFVRIHSGTIKTQTLFIRELPITGNGIADLVVLSWAMDLKPSKSTTLDYDKLNPTLRAFEFKLSEWRKGLMQAHRYKYFSHASILVVPQYKLKIILPFHDLFHRLRVGLWGFDVQSQHITCYYTPRPKEHIKRHSIKAFQVAMQNASL